MFCSKLPDLLDAVGGTIRTDMPVDRLPELAVAIDEMGSGDITRAVIRHPLVRSEDTRYGASLVPDLEAIRAVAADCSRHRAACPNRGRPRRRRPRLGRGPDMARAGGAVEAWRGQAARWMRAWQTADGA